MMEWVGRGSLEVPRKSQKDKGQEGVEGETEAGRSRWATWVPPPLPDPQGPNSPDS